MKYIIYISLIALFFGVCGHTKKTAKTNTSDKVEIVESIATPEGVVFETYENYTKDFPEIFHTMDAIFSLTLRG